MIKLVKGKVELGACTGQFFSLVRIIDIIIGEVVLVVAKFHVFFDLWGLHFIKEFNKFKEKRIMLNFEFEKSIFLRIPKIQLFAAKINIISTFGSLRIE